MYVGPVTGPLQRFYKHFGPLQIQLLVCGSENRQKNREKMKRLFKKFEIENVL